VMIEHLVVVALVASLVVERMSLAQILALV
jgi:hypothetical protein